MTSGSCLSPAAICPSPAQAEKEGSRADKLPNLPIQIARLCLASDSGRHPVLGATPPRPSLCQNWLNLEAGFFVQTRRREEESCSPGS